MKVVDIREILSRIRFLANNLKYNSRKHFYLTTLCLVVILVLIFSAVFIKQRTDIIRKENIVRSFYSGKESSEEESKDDKSRGGLLSLEEAASAGELASLVGDSEDKILYRVHICGEVCEPGVYEVEEGQRIADIIDLAGGATDSACLAAVNLAMKANDGQRIYIPSFEEIEQGSSLYYGDTPLLYMDDAGYNGVENEYENIININTAGTSELEKLPGIGPSTAKKIIEHRNKYGNFKSKEELLDISGIGPKKYGEIKELIRI